jgi:hypothetical protein
MLAVGWVVLNRTADPAFPRRPEKVVAQGCQFGWVCDDRPDEPADARAWRAALAVARELLTAKRPADPTRGAMWFHHAEREGPEWTDRIAPSTRIGDHLFYAKVARLPRPKAKPRSALVLALAEPSSRWCAVSTSAAGRQRAEECRRPPLQAWKGDGRVALQSPRSHTCRKASILAEVVERRGRGLRHRFRGNWHD